jgi:hypothetical protein
MASLGEFTGQLAVPASGAKALKVAGESVSAARAAMRLGDGFFDAGMVEDLDAAYSAATRGLDGRDVPPP